MEICYLGIGTNLGNRRRNIATAIAKVAALKKTQVLKSSRIFQTLPQGGPKGQPRFLNAAIKVKTGLSAATLLKEIKKIEKELGRIKGLRWGPRPIDLDILFYGNRVINTKTLQIPHPRVFERAFVVRPLLDLI